jgi:Mg/Co/Ni transporter MgtE
MMLEHRLARAFLVDHPADAAQALERLPADRRASVLRAAPVESARALGHMVAAAAAESFASLTGAEAAPVLDALALDNAILLLRRMPADAADRLVGALPEKKREWLRRALRYPEGTAGALMDPAVLALPDDISVAEARARLRRQASELLYYLFVVERTGRLVGVLDLSELMRARSRDSIRVVMHERVEHLPAWTPAPAVRMHPGWRSFHAMPVTDEQGRLVGAIRYQTLRKLEQEADGGEGVRRAAVAVGALGELFHLGLAGMVEGVATAATPRAGRAPGTIAHEDRGVR